MYARVPENLKAPLLKELRRVRLRANIWKFPLYAVVISLLFGVAVAAKGHEFLIMLRIMFPKLTPDISLAHFAIGFPSLVTVAVLVHLHHDYLAFGYEDHPFCSDCNAADIYDAGRCPVCKAPLTGKAAIVFTVEETEIKVIERRGIRACKKAAGPLDTSPDGDAPPIMNS